MKRSLIVLALICTLTAGPMAVRAADTGPLFTTPLLGISMGSMVGFLASLATNEPQDHTCYVGIGAGIGLIAGLALAISGMEDTSAAFYRRESAGESLYGFSVLIPLK